MFGLPLLSPLTYVFPQQTQPSQTPPPEAAPGQARLATPLEIYEEDLSVNLELASLHLPPQERVFLQTLCDFLVCLENLWPGAASGVRTDTAAPFSLHQKNQSLQIDWNCIENTLRHRLGRHDETLPGCIKDYVLASDERHWQALQKREHAATLIDPADQPRHWPRECLAWAMLSMQMQGADLSFGDLSALDLRYVDFREARLGYACLDDAQMEGANLIGAKVEGAMFRRTDMSKARLAGLILSIGEKNLEGANMDDACLEDIGLDIHPHDQDANGVFAVRPGALPPPLDLLVRQRLNLLVKQEHSSLAARYLHRLLPHIAISADFCRESLELAPPDDQLAVLQAIGDIEGIDKVFAEIDVYIAHQFHACIDRENPACLQKILDDICQKNLAYLNSVSDDLQRTYWIYLTGVCLRLPADEKYQCLKDLIPALLNGVMATARGFDPMRQAVRHLNQSNPAQAFQSLTCHLTPRQLHDAVQADLDYAALAHAPETSKSEEKLATAAMHAAAIEEDISDFPLIPDKNPRELIDLIHENLSPAMQRQIHTLLRDSADGALPMHKGDCDYLDSYTEDENSAAAGIGDIARQMHADQLPTAPHAQRSAPYWQTALLAYSLLPIY
ncbi:MAG TPA: pentapeptide repeat-containing protein [Herbaspirillum sp.]|jgi:uncharacterized protein YjbI with pentapeptide repeats